MNRIKVDLYNVIYTHTLTHLEPIDTRANTNLSLLNDLFKRHGDRYYTYQINSYVLAQYIYNVMKNIINIPRNLYIYIC